MRIFAFYSFKGGVGRTALLVNLAAHWASQGRVVGLVDMDLAAPGLSYLLDDGLTVQAGFGDLMEVYHTAWNEPLDVLAKPVQERSSAPVEESSEAFLADIVQLPPWHWPLSLDPNREVDPQQRMRELIGEWRHVEYRAEVFLNGVAGSISLSKDDKLGVLRIANQFSTYKIKELINIFNKEKQTLASLQSMHANSLLEKYFQFQKEWAEIVAPSMRVGRYRFLHWPLLDLRPFPAWEQRDHYWWLLARELLTEPGGQTGAMDAIRKALALPGIPIKKVEQVLQFLQEDERGWNRRLLQLAKDAAQGDPWSHFLILKKAFPKPKPDEIQAILQPLLQNPPDTWPRVVDLVQWIRFEQPALIVQAETMVRGAIGQHPDRAELYNTLGDILQHHTQCRFFEAEAAYLLALQFNAEFIPSLLGVGYLYSFNLMRAQDAEEKFLEVFAIDGSNIAAIHALSFYYFYNKMDFKKGVQYCRLGLSLELNFPYFLKYDGYILLVLGQERLARKSLSHALNRRLKESSVGMLCLRAILSIALGHPPETCNELFQAIEEGLLHHVNDFDLLLARSILTLEAKPIEEMACGWLLHEQRLHAILEFYLLAGLRADLRERCRQALRWFLDPPAAILENLKDAPLSKEWLDRFRPFAEGCSHGAGDPRDLSLFCPNAAEIMAELFLEA
ncbi:MAG: P-loop NTPase [Magnetococcales bacterium]|nr:P-loop NTPase [Magnetococcales bacterium]